MLVEVTLLTSVALAAVMHFGAGWGFGACAAIVAFSLLVIDDGNKVGDYHLINYCTPCDAQL